MNPEALPTLVVLVAAVVAGVGWQAARRPIPRRLALRGVARRPGESILVVLGSMLGTALIAGSFIVGDTLDASIRAGAVTSLGPIDEVVETPERSVAADVERVIGALRDRRIDGVLSFASAPAAATAKGAGRLRSEPRAQVIEIDFDAARRFGRDPEATGISGPSPGSGEVVLNEDAATSLEVREGDEIDVFLYRKRLSLRVVRVLPELGVAGYSTGLGDAPNAFVAPGTIVPAARRAPRAAAPPTNTVAISNRGGVEEGAELTEEVAAVIERALGGDLRVQPVKRDVLDAAEAQGDQFGQLFLAIGSFAVVAGVLLLVNIFVMVAEERKSELGMLRAIGIRRIDLVRAFVVEGACYSLAAALLGAVAGVGVGWAIVRLAAPIFSSGEEFSLELLFASEPSSVAAGLCLGLLISMTTIFLTSVRIARLNIIRAVRDLPEPARPRARLRTILIGVLLSGAGAAMFGPAMESDDAWLGAILGPPLFAFGLAPLAGRLVGRRIATSAAASVGLVWGIFGNTILDGRFFDSGELFAFVVQGILLTFSAVVLLSNLQENMAAGVRRIAGRNISLRLSLAYPLARRFRTALTLGMYSLVMFTMVFIAAMTAVFGGQLDTAVVQESGGYDMLVRTSGSNPVSAARLRGVEGVREVAPLIYAHALWRTPGAPEPAWWPVTGIGERFITGEIRALEERAEGYGSDREVWQAVLRDPNLVVISSFFLQFGGGPPASVVDMGDEVTLVNPVTGGETRRTVVAATATDYAFGGAFMSRGSVASALSETAAPSRHLVGADDPAAVAKRLETRFVEEGLVADTLRALVEEEQASSVQFLNLMQGYLALGLVVGIAGLGVVMIRAVRERRREIGVLRSLGFLPARVRRAFLFESGFVALEGIGVGAALALVTASQLTANGDFGEGIEFVVPWGAVAVLLLAALTASLLATAAPAQQASRIPPAVALRLDE